MKARALASISSGWPPLRGRGRSPGRARAVLGALEQHLQQRVGDAQQPYGADDAAASGQQAERDLGAADLGAGRVEGDAVVAGERDLVAAAQGRAVDRGDDGLAEGLDAAQVALDGEAAVEELLGGLRGDADQVAQVAAREEGLLGGGDDDAADGVLGSASRRSVIAASESRNAAFMVFADWSGSSRSG
jgi:hypothetical protein